jgi:hypothetical protein
MLPLSILILITYKLALLLLVALDFELQCIVELILVIVKSGGGVVVAWS